MAAGVPFSGLPLKSQSPLFGLPRSLSQCHQETSVFPDNSQFLSICQKLPNLLASTCPFSPERGTSAAPYSFGSFLLRDDFSSLGVTLPKAARSSATGESAPVKRGPEPISSSKPGLSNVANQQGTKVSCLPIRELVNPTAILLRCDKLEGRRRRNKAKSGPTLLGEIFARSCKTSKPG